jgi:hypothetical protein
MVSPQEQKSFGNAVGEDGYRIHQDTYDRLDPLRKALCRSLIKAGKWDLVPAGGV